jgi:adenylate cyclase
MQERGDLVHDGDGNWVEGSTLDWETMPARVEAVIAERIGRLAQPLQAALQVASVEGEVFTAEVLAQVLKTDERELLVRLSGELDKQHRLIRAESIQRMNGQLISSYRFQHILFQKYLYSSLDEVERVHLHEQVGAALEGLYSIREEIPVIALQLARHFEEAGIPEKAIHYLHQAGERAIRLSAYEEGISHLNRGLELLYLLPDSSKRDQQELTLQLSIGMAWKYNWSSPQGRNAINQARELSQQLGKTDHLSRVLGELAIYHYVHAEYHQAIEVASDALSLAEQESDPTLVAEGHWLLGFLKFCLGDYITAKTHLEHVIAFYNPEEHHRSLIFLRGVDVGLSAMAYYACCLWCLGYPDQAMKISKEALALARGFNHPFTLADVLCFAGCVFNAMLRNARILEDCAEELLQIATSESLYMSGWYGMASNFKGVALTMQGQAQKGMEHIQECITSTQASGIRLYNVISLQSLAKAQAEVGDTQAGLDTLGEAMTVLKQTDDRHLESELHRLKAELLIAEGDDSSAESSFAEALEVSRKQQAMSWELRSSIGLAHLWQKQGKVEEARTLLESIYNWFTEGFDSPDLKEAKALLDDLSCNNKD